MAKIYDRVFGGRVGARASSVPQSRATHLQVSAGSIPTASSAEHLHTCSRGVAFSFVSVLILYAQMRLQGPSPLNPDHTRVSSPSCRQHRPPSISSPIPTGRRMATAHESPVMQMTRPRIPHFVSSGTGAAVCNRVGSGLTRRRTRTLGPLGRSDRYLHPPPLLYRVRGRHHPHEPGR